MVKADRDRREKDERLRAPYAAARMKWASTLQQGFAARPENAITASQTAQFLGELGRTDQAVAVLKWRMARVPRDSFAGRQLTEFLLQARALDESIATARALLNLFPDDHRPYVIIARALLLQGDASAALVEISKAASVHDPLTLSMIEHSLGHKEESTEALGAYLAERRGLRKSAKLAEVHACRGEFSRVFECMERAIRDNIHDPELCQVTHSPFMDEIRRDERWLPLLRRMNRAPEQLDSIPFDFHLP